MKLVKLSLAVALAAGALSTASFAVPLEEAVKDVDVSGYLRMRYTHDQNQNEETGYVKKNDSKWQYKGVVNFKTKIDDNFFAVVGIQYHSGDIGKNKAEVRDENNNPIYRTRAYSTGKDRFSVRQAYLGYNIGGTTIQVGRQTVGTFFTDDMVGSGIKVLNKDIEGLTLAALWMDSLEEDGDILSMKLEKVKGKEVIDHNLYGAAVMGSYDPVSFQIWYAALQDVVSLFAVETATDFDINDDVKLGLKGQYGFARFDGDYKDVAHVGNSDFYAAELSADLFGFDGSVGYVNYKTKKDKISLSSFEDDGSFINAGEELIDYAKYEGENDYWFVTAGYTFGDVRIGGDYLDGKNKTRDSKIDMNEWVARVDYKYSSKLKFKAWYSQYEMKHKFYDNAEDKKDKNDRVRFEAKYSF